MERKEDGRRILVLLNPVAGGGKSAEVYALLQHHLDGARVDYRVHELRKDEPVRGLIRNAQRQGFTQVVAAGGDGTVSAVADALVGTELALSILPLGTANLLARDLGIPLVLDEACELLYKEHAAVSVDAMHIDGRSYISHVSLGIYSQIVEETTVEQKQKYGRLAYLWNGLKKASARSTWPFRLVVDGEEVHIRASLVLLANVSSVGVMGLQWGEAVDPTDGVISVCVVRARSVSDYVAVLWHMAHGQHRRAPNMLYLPARQHVEIETNAALPLRGDGEIIGDSKACVDVVPAALRVLVPPAAKSVR